MTWWLFSIRVMNVFSKDSGDAKTCMMQQNSTSLANHAAVKKRYDGLLQLDMKANGPYLASISLNSRHRLTMIGVLLV